MKNLKLTEYDTKLYENVKKVMRTLKLNEYDRQLYQIIENWYNRRKNKLEAKGYADPKVGGVNINTLVMFHDANIGNLRYSALKMALFGLVEFTPNKIKLVEGADKSVLKTDNKRGSV